MVRVGYSEWEHRELVLGSHVQHFPARHQDLEVRAASQEGRHLLCRAHHMLKVIQQQQHLPRSQLLRKKGEERPATSFPDGKHLGDGGYDQGRIAEGSQIHEKHAMLEPITQVCCHLQAKASFARSTWAGECYQAHVLVAQEVLESCLPAITTHERRRL